MQIFDAHHHLWDLGHCHYPWLMERGEPRFFGDPTPIQRNYLVEDLQRDAVRFELVGSTHIQVGVQPGDEIKESRWLSELHDVHNLPSAIVGFCDLSVDEAELGLAAQAEVPGVRGIRQIVGRELREDLKHNTHRLLTDPIWLQNFGKLADYDLSFDLQLVPELHLEAALVLAQYPMVQVAICHAGSPWDQTSTGLRQWRWGMQNLAEQPNAHCKISGLAMFTHRCDFDEWRKIIDQVIEIFGIERVMFGSNFPVDKLYTTYSDVWDVFSRCTQHCTETEREALFCDNARRFYRLDTPQ